SLEQRFTEVEMPDPIRQTLLRYIGVRAAVLRPKSVESLINDLLPSPNTSPLTIPTSSACVNSTGAASRAT
ncbi:phage integrase family domain protein, partial [Mycobacterium avium MAV_120809_2495]